MKILFCSIFLFASWRVCSFEAICDAVAVFTNKVAVAQLVDSMVEQHNIDVIKKIFKDHIEPIAEKQKNTYLLTSKDKDKTSYEFMSSQSLLFSVISNIIIEKASKKTEIGTCISPGTASSSYSMFINPFLSGIRDVDNLIGLYHAIAKYVGRMNINGCFTGTGTLISYPGMPASLKGRVVLSCAHNYYDMGALSRVVSNRSHAISNIGGVDTICESPVNDYVLNTSEEMSFMLDLSDSMYDIAKYPPDVASNLKLMTDKNHKVIGIKKVYAIGENYGVIGQMPDIAVYILDEDSGIEGVDISDPPEVGVGTECFSIGYGSGDWKNTLGSEWNKKKMTSTVKVAAVNKDYNDIGIGKVAGSLLGPDGFLSFSGINTPSDSGSPLVDASTNKVIGVVSGVEHTFLKELLRWIQSVVSDAESNSY